MKKVLIVPSWPLRRDTSRVVLEALQNRQICAGICTSSDEVRGKDLVLIVIGGKDSNFALLRQVGVAARESGVPMVYAIRRARKIISRVIKNLERP